MESPEGGEVDRRKTDPWREQMEQMTVRMASFEESLKANTELTQSLKNDTSEMIEIFKTAKGGFKALEALSKIAKWLGILAGAGSAIVALYYQIRNGWPPK